MSNQHDKNKKRTIRIIIVMAIIAICAPIVLFAAKAIIESRTKMTDIDPTVINTKIEYKPMKGDKYELRTNYASFIITDGEKTIEVKNTKKVSGSMELTGHVCTPDYEVGGDPEYLTELPALEKGSYTITPTSLNLKVYNTQMLYHGSDIYDLKNGFYADIDMMHKGQIVISPAGEVRTILSDIAYQNIRITRNEVTTPWYTVGVKAISLGVDLNCRKNKATVTSKMETDGIITVENDFDEVEFHDIAISEDEVTVKQKDTNICDIIKGEDIIASDEIALEYK